MKLKRLFSIILCLLLLACLVPTGAFAAVGANTQSVGGVFASVTLSGAADKVLFSGDETIESQILAPDAYTEARYLPVESASYDRESNTLTLTNFAGEGVTLNLRMMGPDFAIRLVGSSTLSAIRSESLGYGGSIRFCGEGSLTVNNPDGCAIYLDAGGAEDFVRVEAQAQLTVCSASGGAIRVVNSPLGPDAIRFDTATPEVGPWDIAEPLTDRRTSDGTLIDVCTLEGSEELYGLAAKADETGESILYDIYRLSGTDEYGAYYAELAWENVADVSAFTAALSQHDVSLYEINGATPVSSVRFARFTLRARGSDEKGSVSVSPSAVGRGGAATVRVEPAEGCKLQSLTINGETVRPTDGVYTINHVSADMTIEAVFCEAAASGFEVTAPASTDFRIPADGEDDFVSEPFTATVTDGGGDPIAAAIRWSVMPHTDGVSIDSDGRVRVGNEAKNAVSGSPIRYTVTAEAPDAGFSDSSHSFTVARAASAPYAVKILRGDLLREGEDEITIPAAGETAAAYRAVVLDPYGEVLDVPVVWSAGDWPLGVRRDGNVVYVSASCTAGSSLQLMATAESDSTVAALLTLRFAAPTIITAQSETHIDSVPAASAKALAAEMVTLPTKVLHTGSALTPAVTVIDGETALVKDTDYSLSYEDNTDVGTASVTVTGLGAYSGTIVKTFRIVELAVTWPTRTEADNKSYGTTLGQLVTLSDDGSATIDGGDAEGSFALKNADSIPDVGGKYRIVFRSADGELVKESEEYTLTKLAKKSITAAMVTVTPAEMVYTGSALEPAVLVKDGDRTLLRDTDYSVAYANNTAIGTAAKVTVTGSGNYKDSAELSFTITKIPANSLATGVLITARKPEDKGTAPTLVIKDGDTTLTEGEDYTVKYAPDIDKKTGTATITFKGNYSGTLTKEYNLPNYLVVEGAGASWSKSTSLALEFRANGALGKFTGLTVDGTAVDAKYYTKSSGSTIVQISAEYLKNLAVGKHIIGVVYSDGKALAIFSVTAAARRGVATGDNNHVFVWAALMAASLVALGTLGWLYFRERRGRRKKKKTRR